VRLSLIVRCSKATNGLARHPSSMVGDEALPGWLQFIPHQGLRGARTLQCEAFVRERFNQIYQHVNELFMSFDLTDTAAHHDSI
jgi:hypothetical protein